MAVLSVEVIRYFRARKPEVAREEKDLEQDLEPLRDAIRGEAG